MFFANTRKAAIIGFVVLAATACAREQPVYNVENHPIPGVAQNLSPSRIEKAIILAGADRGWTFTPSGAGHMLGHLDHDHHTADIDVIYSRAAYSIRYTGSSNLLASADGQQIHRNYNKWIHLLEQDIDTQLTKASVQ